MGDQGVVFVIVSILIGGLAYFLPTIIVTYRNHKNMTSIFFLNLLLGWTFLGWVAALIWSFSAKDSTSEPQNSSFEKPTVKQESEITKVKNCPFCAEEIKIEAILCKHCGSNLNEQEIIESNA